MQTVPATEIAADHVEEVQSVFDGAYRDGVVDLDEARRIRHAIRLAIHSADRANLARAIGICVQRGGVGGQRHLRLMRQWAELDGLAPCDGDDPQSAA